MRVAFSPPGSLAATGWQALSVLRWPIAVIGVTGVAILVLQATRRAPALPVAVTVLALIPAAVTLAGLIYRVIIAVPGIRGRPANAVVAQPGAYLAIALNLAVVVGIYWSMRLDATEHADATTPVERLRLS